MNTRAASLRFTAVNALVNSGADRSSAGPLVDAYEELRSQVLAAPQRGSHNGLVMVVREGLAAWIDRQTACSREAPARVTAPPLVPDVTQANIVCLLASMAMAGRKEMHA